MIANIKGISPSTCLHRILLEENSKSSKQAQRRLNPPMVEVVKNEVLKLLDTRVIYPISDNKQVSQVQVVSKKIEITVIENQERESFNQSAEQVESLHRLLQVECFHKKDHFSLSFIDQMLERQAGRTYYYYLNRYFGFYQISIVLEDQAKTTFACPFGTFGYGECHSVFTMHQPPSRDA